MRKLALACLACLATIGAGQNPALAQNVEKPVRFQIPPTVSPEAAKTLGSFYAMVEQSRKMPWAPPKSVEDWHQQNALMEAVLGPAVKANAEAMRVTVKEDALGGVPVLRITSPDHKPDARTLIYVHGGGYTLFSARTSLTVPALMAVASGTEVISIDYTLAPRGNWRTASDQVLAVYRAVLAKRKADAIGMFGDSAGGGLAAGSVLKMRDQGLALPGALYLLSPWSDITETGDSYATLADADPTLTSASLKVSALAYVDEPDMRNPYVSPVYGDYGKPFPATLIQCGTREIFLSNCVRHYRAIRGGGHDAILDLYEGMPHVWQAIAPFVPETTIAIRTAAEFFDRKLSRR